LAVDRLQLRPGEQVLVHIRPHWSYLSGPLAVAAVTIGLGVALDVGFPHATVVLHRIEGLVVAVPCLWLAVRTARWWTTSLILTSDRLVEQWGVSSPRQAETLLADMASVTAVQSLLRRMVGTGRLELELLGDDRVRRIDDVRKPAILQRIITRRLRPVPGGDGGAGGHR
jgi:Bacterial PH domain